MAGPVWPSDTRRLHTHSCQPGADKQTPSELPSSRWQRVGGGVVVAQAKRSNALLSGQRWRRKAGEGGAPRKGGEEIDECGGTRGDIDTLALFFFFLISHIKGAFEGTAGERRKEKVKLVTLPHPLT